MTEKKRGVSRSWLQEPCACEPVSVLERRRPEGTSIPFRSIGTFAREGGAQLGKKFEKAKGI